MAEAINSLPVPVSPSMHTVARVSITLSSWANTARIAGESPTMLGKRCRSSRFFRYTFSPRARSSASLSRDTRPALSSASAACPPIKSAASRSPSSNIPAVRR